MTTAPGWYPDPQSPTQMRWWDGAQWSEDTFERVEPVGGYLAPVGAAPPDQPQPNPYGAVSQHPAHPPAGMQRQLGGAVGPTTPDGVRLASWRRRVAARLIDGLVTGVVSLLLAIPVLADFWRRLIDLSRQQAETGSFDPSTSSVQLTLRETLSFTAVVLLVSACYEIGFLLWRQATPGKLLLGLRVRRLADESLPVAAVVVRWAAYVLPAQVRYVGWVYVLADVLWPLWDANRQALHDKLARTCVVHPDPSHPSAGRAG